jgi:hypothetical protein
MAIGAGLNLLVMAANGGLMPIAPAVLHALVLNQAAFFDVLGSFLGGMRWGS